MARIRLLLTKYPVAVGIAAAVVAVAAVWIVVHRLNTGGPAAPSPTAAVRPPASAGASGGAPADSGPLGIPPRAARGAASALSTASGAAAGVPDGSTGKGATPGGPASSGQPAAGAAGGGPGASTAPPDTGRRDPFAPLIATGGGGGSAPLPPVPPLAPGALPGPGGPAAGNAAGPRSELRLTGIIYGPAALAILSDGTASYIVQPGDAVASGVRVLAIDAGNRRVTLAWNNQTWQLRLGGETSL